MHRRFDITELSPGALSGGRSAITMSFIAFSLLMRLDFLAAGTRSGASPDLRSGADATRDVSVFAVSRRLASDG